MDYLSRRTMLKTATAAAAIAVAASPALAQTGAASPAYGAPLVEINVPAGLLTLEQKAAMIKGVTDVLARAAALQPDQVRRTFVRIIETAEGGFGVAGQVFVPRGNK